MNPLSAAAGELDEDLSAVADRLRRSTVQVFAPGGHGSGLIATQDGIVVTNAHVARGRRARVVLADGRETKADIVAEAAHRDLAALRIDAVDVPAVEFRETRSLRPGDLVVAVGNPLELVGAVTTGIVHASDPRGRRVVADLRLLPGNSGGPLADSSGRVVGVNAMVVNGLAVAVSAEVVKRFLASPHTRPYIGVVTQPLAVSVMGERRLGLLVVELTGGGRAERAGVYAGDVLIGVDGRLFSSPEDLADEIDTADVGARLRLDVVRGGAVTGIDVVVGNAKERHAPAA